MEVRKVKNCTQNALGNRNIAPSSFEAQFYERPEHKKNTYDILHQAMERVEDFFSAPSTWLEDIALSRSSSRQFRLRGRFAFATVAKVLIDHIDLVSMRVVRRTQSGKWLNLDIQTIANLADIGYRRCQRALDVFKKAGYIEFTYNKGQGPYGYGETWIAIKRLSYKFFYQLGITQLKLQTCIHHARKKLTTHQQPEKNTQKSSKSKHSHSIGDWLNSTLKTPFQNRKPYGNKGQANTPTPQSQAPPSRRKTAVGQLAKLVVEFNQAHPNCPKPQLDSFIQLTKEKLGLA